MNIGGPDIRGSRAAHLQKLRQFYPIPGPIPEVIETERQVPTSDGQAIRVRIYSPKQAPPDGSPLILMYHEGGWCMGDLTDEELNCRMFCRDLGVVCINVEYRLAQPTTLRCPFTIQRCAIDSLPASRPNTPSQPASMIPGMR